MPKLFDYSYYGSCDPMIEGNTGIWFNEEDPDDINYKPQCCRNVYIDLAKGYFDRLDINCDYEYDADDDGDDYYEDYEDYEDYYEAEGDDYDY